MTISDIGEVGMFGVHKTMKPLLVKKLSTPIGEKYQFSIELMSPLIQHKNILPYLVSFVLIFSKIRIIVYIAYNRVYDSLTISEYSAIR